MRRLLAILGSAVFLVIACGLSPRLVPCSWDLPLADEAPFFGMQIVRFIGAILVALGIVSLLDSFLRFALQGLGTPAPIFPARHLVVTGPIVMSEIQCTPAVVMTILGQGFILGNIRLLEYGAVVWLPAYLFVLLYEEPTLGQLSDRLLKSYCAEVPRWIPRFTPVRNDLEKATLSHRLRR